MRTFAALAFADELVANPEILRTYTDAFGDRDDASLVIYAPGRQPAEIAGALGQAMRPGRHPGGRLPDLLVVAADGGREGEAALAGAVDAAYTRRNRDGAFAGLDHFDDGRVAICGCSRSGAGVAWRRERRSPAALGDGLAPSTRSG